MIVVMLGANFVSQFGQAFYSLADKRNSKYILSQFA